MIHDMALLNRSAKRWHHFGRSLVVALALSWFVVALLPPAHAQHQTEEQEACAAFSTDTIVTCIMRCQQQTMASADEIHRDVGRVLVSLARSEITDPALRAEAIDAIRAVADSYHSLSFSGRALTEAAENHPPPSDTSSVDPHLAAFLEAAARVDETAELLRTAIEALLGQIADSDLDRHLRRFVADAEVHAAAQTAVAAAASALTSAMYSSYVTRDQGGQGIRLSLYDFLDPDTEFEHDYGLYTYVLFRAANARGERLLQALLSSTGWAEHARLAEPAAINVFIVPVRDRIQTLVAVRTSNELSANLVHPDFYDYSYAASLLVNLCVSAAGGDLPDYCLAGGGGPYLLSHPERLTPDSGIAEPYLLVDLSDVHERAFGEFVRAVKEQVMLAEFNNREKLDTFRLQLLDVALKAGDWLIPVKDAVAGIITLAGSSDGRGASDGR